jgi:hypothetical protein
MLNSDDNVDVAWIIEVDLKPYCYIQKLRPSKRHFRVREKHIRSISTFVIRSIEKRGYDASRRGGKGVSVQTSRPQIDQRVTQSSISFRSIGCLCKVIMLTAAADIGARGPATSHSLPLTLSPQSLVDLDMHFLSPADIPLNQGIAQHVQSSQHIRMHCPSFSGTVHEDLVCWHMLRDPASAPKLLP